MADIINLANERTFRAWEETKRQIRERRARNPSPDYRFPVIQCALCAGTGRQEWPQGSGVTRMCECVGPESA